MKFLPQVRYIFKWRSQLAIVCYESLRKREERGKERTKKRKIKRERGREREGKRELEEEKGRERERERKREGGRKRKGERKGRVTYSFYCTGEILLIKRLATVHMQLQVMIQNNK